MYLARIFGAYNLESIRSFGHSVFLSHSKEMPRPTEQFERDALRIIISVLEMDI